MTTEEKYKAALERAKRLRESEFQTMNAKRVVDEIFPELAETEDERVIKWIASYIHKGVFNEEEHPKALRAIEWLEKQKLSEWSDLDKEMLESIIERGSVEVPPHTRALCSDHILWLQWLKEGRIAPKQKEQKPAEKQDYSGLNDLERAIHRGFLCAGVENVPVTIIKETAQEFLVQMKPAERSLEDDHIIGFVYDLLNEIEWKENWAMSKDECLRLLNNYSPQKPAEWSDTDNIGWADAFACVHRAKKEAKNEEEFQNVLTAEEWLKEIKFKYCANPVKQELSEEDEKNFECCLRIVRVWEEDYNYSNFLYSTWLKSLPERFNLQPKQAWSEEDERMRQTAIEACKTVAEDYENSNSRFFKCKDWLKSLSPQPKAELTLLDQNIINAAVAFVEQNDHFNCWGGIDKQLVIKALRSLKPHWKPSEEQMKTLCTIEQILRKDKRIALADIVNTLYNDLKQRM